MPRKIPDQIKMNAVARAVFEGESQADIAREFGVSESAVYQWKVNDYPNPKKEWADPLAKLSLERLITLIRGKGEVKMITHVAHLWRGSKNAPDILIGTYDTLESAELALVGIIKMSDKQRTEKIIINKNAFSDTQFEYSCVAGDFYIRIVPILTVPKSMVDTRNVAFYKGA